jgi:3'(2'), 5'-bisphosphate nucleotidase
MARSPDLSHGSLAHLTDIARRAGDAVMEFYGSASAPTQKPDGAGPVTTADYASQRIITEALTSWSEIPIVSEEMPVPDYATRRSWTRFWIIDPLDGTKEFLAQNGEFTINVALVEGDRPVLGVVYAPALGTMYFSGCNLGSWRQRGTERAERLYSAPRPKGEPVRIVESRSHRSDAQEAFIATLSVSERIAAGSSLKFCRIAEGHADVYPRFVPAMEWDLAAGDCVYRNSGRDCERVSPL